MADLRLGELTDAEIVAAREPLISQGDDAIYRAIATAAYEKAMKRAAEVCIRTVPHHYVAQSCAAAIEREAR